MAVKRPPVMISPSDRVPGRASEPSRSRVGDGGGLGCFLENMIGYRGFPRRRQFIGERATRGGDGVTQVGPTHGQGLGRAWVAYGGCRPPCSSPPGSVFVSCENNSRKFSDDFEKLPRTTFLKQKDNRKQELALGILLIG